MKPQKQSVQINFAKGLQTKLDPWQVPVGNFLSLKNTVFDEVGALKKRNGYEDLPATINAPLTYTYKKFGANITAGSFAGSYLDEEVMGDGLSFYSFSDSTNEWSYKGRLESNEVSQVSIYQDQYNNIMADSAVNNTSGLSLYAWESWTENPRTTGVLRGVTFSLRDTVTQQNLYSLDFSNITSRPRCVAIGTFLYLIYFNSSTNRLVALSITDNPPLTSTDIITDINTTNPNYDVLVVGSTLYVAYNGTGTTVKIASFNSSMTPIASASKAESGSNGVSVFSDTSNNLWVAYNNGAATKAYIMNSALAVTVLAPTIVDAGATAIGVQNVTGIYDGTQGIIFYDQPGLPIVGQYLSAMTSASYTQPAVNSDVLVTFTQPVNFLNGTLVYVNTGGYYLVDGYTATTTLGLKNLGFTGNAAPGATIGTSAVAIAPVYGYSNAVINFNTLTVLGVAGTAAEYIRAAALGSRAFLIGTTAHVLISHDAELQPTYFMSSLYNVQANSTISKANIVSKICMSEAGGIPRTSIIPGVNLDADGNYVIGLAKVSSVITTTRSNVQSRREFNGIVSEKINFSPTEVSRVELGNQLHVGGGVINSYDGNSVTELGFHLYPENVTGVYTAASGELGQGDYGYQVVYQWNDAQGQKHRSAPSPVLTVTTPASGGSILLTIPTLRITSKSNVIITIYRTEVNGSIYYRLDTEYSAYPFNNNNFTDRITFTDLTPDANIIGNEQIYTTGEVENIAPPASNSLGYFKNRLNAIPSENPYGFWYSKQILSGSPVEMSDLFVLNLGTIGGAIVGMGNLDDKLILGKTDSFYYIVGTGPAPSGANNDFSEPIFITSDSGLRDRNSFVTMPHGLMYKSTKGIYLLDRSMQSIYIGNPVESYNQYNVLSARLMPNTNQVRLLLDTNIALLYDYFVDQWGSFEAISGISDIVKDNKQNYLSSDGIMHRETPGQYLDGALPVLMSFTTNWIELAGLQGYQRSFFFFLLGKYLSPHQWNINLYTNFSASSDQNDVITPDSSSTLENWRVFVKNQRCQSFQVAFNELYTGTPGAAFTLSGLNLVIGAKSSFRTIPYTQSVG